jgi:nicotinamide mononucleotide transporter
MEINGVLRYLQLHGLEILGALTGLIYVFFSIKRKRILWIFGGLSSVLYIIVFYNVGLLAYMMLYMYYVVVSLAGWYAWAPQKADKHGSEKRISRLGFRSWLTTMLVITVLFGLIAVILRYFDQSEALMSDAILTSASIVATWLLMRRIIDHWLVWIVIDLFSGILALFKDLPFTAFLFFIYTLLAIKGYLEWRKELRTTTYP